MLFLCFVILSNCYYVVIVNLSLTRFSLVRDDPDLDETLEEKDTLDNVTGREALAAVVERTTQESQIPSFL